MSAVFSCSIDDGHPSDMRAAELLAKHGLNATFYIPIKNREGLDVLCSQAIRQLGEQFEIGSHTLDHRFLKDVRLPEARYQICEGKSRLEDLIGRQVHGFCYPGGKYRPEHIELVAAAGFSYARTTLNLCFDIGSRPFEMPTTVQFYPHERDVYLRNFVRGGSWTRRQDGLRLALRHANWLARLYALFDHSFEHNGVFHLWGHSRDIDRFEAWDEFDRFLAYVAAHMPRRNCVSNAELAARSFVLAPEAAATV
ncbi:MAG TPA: polysaccharide deacetylase family protein [Paucimonas sp.]|nr:polysaccharide deacetylase family protein [Paucimonas sp.]